MPRDSKNLTDQVEYFTPLNEDQRAKARRTVCGFAESAEDAAELMRALGIHPSQDGEDGPILDPIPAINSFGG